MASTAITPTHIDSDTFANKVLADGLQVLEAEGYLYARGKGKEVNILYRTYKHVPRRFWTYTNRFTETAAGGGSNTVRMYVDEGAMRLVSMTVQMCDSAAGRTTNAYSEDEDGANVALWGGASIDNQYFSFPSIGTAATAATNSVNTKDYLIPGDGSKFKVSALSLAQNEYFDIRCTWELIGTATAPTVAHTSTGTASTGTATQNEVTEVPIV